MAKELEKVLTIDDEDYNINAVEATKVQNTLSLNKHKLTGTTTEVFNGQYNKTIDYVPSDGGLFTGEIRVPDSADSEIDDSAVLNYKDLKNKVFEEFVNNSAIYNWNGNTCSPVSTEGTVNGISIIRGADTDAARTTFAIKNSQNKQFLSYFYIGTSSPYNIYFGTANDTTMTRLAANAGSAANAETADKLKNSRNIKINLATTSTQGTNFDGSTDIVLGVNGTLPVARGGTGQGSLTNVTVGKANQLTTARKLYVDFSKDSTTLFNGASTTGTAIGTAGTLPVAKGGTGQTNLTNVTVGKADAVKVYLDSTGIKGNVYPNIKISSATPLDSEGNNGDIWIKYSKSN